MDREIVSEPRFEVYTMDGVKTIGVDDADGTPLEFNAKGIGPKKFRELREASYYSPGRFGFKTPTFGELAPLVYSAMTHKGHELAKQVIGTLRNDWMIGKTIVLKGNEGIFVDDNPDWALVKGDLGVYESNLRQKLGERKEGNVAYSDDGVVRFVPHGFQLREQSSLAFAENQGLIALVGNPERAIMLAKASENYRRSPWLGEGFAKTNYLQLQVPNVIVDKFVSGVLRLVVGSRFYCGSLDICGKYPDHSVGFSFGVRKGAEGTHTEKQSC